MHCLPNRFSHSVHPLIDLRIDIDIIIGEAILDTVLINMKFVTEITKLVALVALCSLAKPASAFTLILDETTGGVTQINNLEIEEKIYDVSFVGGSFLDHFGMPDTPEFNAPTFWGDDAGGESALKAIMNALGNDAFIVDNGSVTWDAFFLPTKNCEECSIGWTGYPWISGLTDGNSSSSIDTVSGFSRDMSVSISNSVWRYAKFEESESRSVPEPIATIPILAVTVAGLLATYKRKRC